MAGKPIAPVDCWVVEWRTPFMPASAFWYYRDEKDALMTADAMRRGHATTAIVRPACAYDPPFLLATLEGE